MKILFNKYEGAGNDFIIIENSRRIIDPSDHRLIRHLCDRRFGIGADGLILVSPRDGYDFEMLYFNSDGHPSTMCGNGGRCAAHFMMRSSTGFRKLTFITADGIHTAQPSGNLIDLSINDVNEIINTPDGFLINTGVPHLVIFMDEIDDIDIVSFARPLRYSPYYAPAGVNVNIVKADSGTLKVRTYERGVEDETLACGTGVTASAIAAVKAGKIVTDSVKVSARGGTLHVSFTFSNDKATGIHLTGPATFVFSGEIEIQ